MSKVEFDIEIPTEDTDIELVNPTSMGLFGPEKSGKTKAVLDLPGCLVIELERKGADFAKGRKLKLPEDLTPLEKMGWLRAAAKKVKLMPPETRPKYVAIDSLTEVDEWSEWTGTERYMKSNAGQNWNRWNKKDHPTLKPEFWGKTIPFGDDKYESINDQEGGYGYRWSRREMVDIFSELNGLGTVCTIFIMHRADNKDTKKITGDTEVGFKGLALTGLLKNIIARKLDAIGYVYHQDGKTMVNFQQNEDKVGGMRGAHHLRGYNGPLDWSKIFIDDTSK